MDKKALGFLKTLCETMTPSGWETPGQRVVADYVKPYCDDVRLDVHGNLHAVLNPGAKFRVMLDGHCDEIGLIVQYVDDKGFIYVQPVGGVNRQLLPGERVVFKTERGMVRGVVGCKAIHHMSARERDAGVAEISDLWIDIGATSKKETLKHVPLGTPGIVETGWRELLGDRVAARAFDDRVGVFVVMDVLRRLKGRKLNVALHVLSATQEELGLLGATTAAFGIDPHAGIAVDVTFASDSPAGVPKVTGEVNIGGGPVLSVGPAHDAALNAYIKNAAKKSALPLQIRAQNRGNGTDMFAIRMTRAGVPTALLGVPLRYMHSAVETLSLGDVDACSQLIADTIASLPALPQLGPKL